MTYVRALDKDQALAMLAEARTRVVCGGTDWMPTSVQCNRDAILIDISQIKSLRNIVQTDDAVHVGAATTWAAIEAASLPRALAGLQDAAREIGSWQIRNCATVGGNICNGSPAADGVTMLLALDASVVVESLRGTRRMPLESFLLDKGRVDLRESEMLTEIVIPCTALGHETASSAFCKFGIRRQLNIAVASAAVWIGRESDHAPRTLRVAAGSVAQTPVRLRRLERLLSVDDDLAALLSIEAQRSAEISPIADVRASAEYRRTILGQMLARAYGVASTRFENA
ncbi:FAD binding domain-containing protein [Paraburkholderia caffeinilytica]|uniref:FAD binding domain-containing protein n=1 Tax=Paraburkholderia caffeinilytica TaxID=1761016 RepID=UPI0038BA294E